MFKRFKRRFNNCGKSAAAGLNPGAAADHAIGQLSDFDSSSISGASSCEDCCDEEDEDVEGPTIITIDDGKGGIRHIRVAKPPDTQSEVGFLVENGGGGESMVAPLRNQQQQTPTIGDLLKKEFRGRQLFHLDSSDAEGLRKRIVSKKGVVHIGRSHLERNQRQKYLSDFFNTMLDMKWRYMLLIFTLSFFMSWLGFAIVWFFILLLHGDFEPDHLPDRQVESGWQPCVYAIYNFASCFLFSIETQHTIGYGSRQTSEKCPEAIFVMSFQSVVGVMIQACMVGTIFAKLSRPKNRAQTLLFSKNAVICRRDGHLCLCFRMANMRSSHLVECHTRAILVSKKVTEEGEDIPYHQTELNVGTDLEGREDTVFFIWPMTIVHRIDEESPFYNMSARDFLKKRYELIVVLEGIAEPTGMSVQARTSYLPNEILWGYRFVNILNYKRRDGVYKIDYGSFNQLVRVDTPTCSAKSQSSVSHKAAKEEDNKSVTAGRSPTTTPRTPMIEEMEQQQQLFLRARAPSPKLPLLQSNHASLPCLPRGGRSIGEEMEEAKILGRSQQQLLQQLQQQRGAERLLRLNSAVPVFTTAFVP